MLRKLRVLPPASAAATGVVGVAALAMALVLPSEGVGPLANFWWIAVTSLAVVGWVVFRAGLWTATGVYAAVFWCFHFGLVAALGTGLVQPLELSLWDQLWLLGPFGGDAAYIALIGALAFAAGAGLVQCREPGLPVAVSDRGRVAHPHGKAGSVLVLGAMTAWAVVVVATSGPGGFFSSYGDYLQRTEEFSGLLSIVWLALGFGLVLAVTGEPGRFRDAAIAGFGGFALVALPIGLRGEVLFPGIAALVALARSGWALSPGRTGALALALLVIIPVVKDVRHTGLQGLPDLVLELRVFDAFVEMGGSLHPVEKVVRWHAEGEPLEMGSSYWAPVERAAARILPGVTAVAAENDLRIMNVLVTDRVGAIGFSPVAEAYRNFGAVGVVGVMTLLGVAFARIDRIRDDSLAVLVIATVYLSLLTNVRNSFISVPAQCALGLLLIGGLRMMRHVTSSVFCRSDARTSYVGS